MRTFGILLLLLLCIALCPAYPNQQDNDLRQIGSKEGNNGAPYAVTLRRPPRSIGSFVSSGTQELIWTIVKIPITIGKLIAHAIRDFIFAILDASQLFLYPFRRIMNGIVRTKRDGTPGLVETILLDLPRMIFHPFEFVDDSVKATSNFARNQTAMILQNSLRICWRFLATTGLPWLRRILDRVASMQATPNNVRMLVKNFDTMYNIFQMLGYISPAY